MRFVQADHPFVVAVRDDDLSRVKELIVADSTLVNVQVRGDIYLTGKIWKADEYVDVDEGASHHAGALHFAAFSGHAELAGLLIEHDADISLPAGFGEDRDSDPVGIAAWNGNAETLQVLLDAAMAAGLELNLTPKLHSALAHSAWDKAELLLKYGATHDFYTAAMAGDDEALKRLVENDCDSIDTKHSGFDGTPLEEALKVGRLAMAELLADHGANVSPEAATAMGRIDEVKSLIDQDETATTRMFGNYPLLSWAIFGGQVEVVRILLKNGANPNGGDRWRTTPLGHCALVHGENGAAIVDLLVAAGADIDRKSRGATPVEIANSHLNERVAERLSHYKNTL